MLQRRSSINGAALKTLEALLRRHCLITAEVILRAGTSQAPRPTTCGPHSPCLFLMRWGSQAPLQLEWSAFCYRKSGTLTRQIKTVDSHAGPKSKFKTKSQSTLHGTMA